MPRVSILMPVYNGAAFIAEAIESVINQTFKDWELLVLDDGSTDNSENIVRSYKDKRIKYLKNDTNRGISFSRKRLIQEAQGYYISFLDSDDVALPEKLHTQVSFLDKNKDYTLCGTWGVMIDENGRKIKTIKLADSYTNIRCSLLFSNQFIQSSIVIKKSVFDKEDYNPAYAVAEDYDLWCRMAPTCKMMNIPKPLVKYRYHSSNISEGKKEEINSFTKMVFKRELVNLAIYANDFELDIHAALRDKSFQKISNKEFFGALHEWLKTLGDANQLCRTYDHDTFLATICFRWIFACKERGAFHRMFNFPTYINNKIRGKLLNMIWKRI